jgi:phenylacetate-CoA ligase
MHSRPNLFLDNKKLKQLQLRKLRKLVFFAYNYIPFFNEKLKTVGLCPSDIRTLDDLRKIPFTTKKELQETPISKLIASNVYLANSIKNFTSGSTGYPLTTIAGKRTNDFDGSMWLRASLLNGMRLRDKMIVIKDLSAHPHRYRSALEYIGLMKRDYVSVFEDSKKLLTYFALEQPDILQGYPSSFEIMASFHESVSNVRPRLIFTLGEFLNEVDKNLIRSVFQAEVYDYYGSSEIGLIAWECKQHLGYHVNADNVVVEFVNDKGENVAPSEKGEIVCTNLYNYEMPLIRYRQGDIGTYTAEECDCGIRLPMMELKGGRKDDFLRTTSGQVVPPTIFFPYPFEDFSKIKQFKVIQKRKNEIVIQLVLNNYIDSELLNVARGNIKKVFGQDMEVEFEFLDHLKRARNGKLRKIISLI